MTQVGAEAAGIDYQESPSGFKHWDLLQTECKFWSRRSPVGSGTDF